MFIVFAGKKMQVCDGVKNLSLTLSSRSSHLRLCVYTQSCNSGYSDAFKEIVFKHKTTRITKTQLMETVEDVISLFSEPTNLFIWQKYKTKLQLQF